MKPVADFGKDKIGQKLGSKADRDNQADLIEREPIRALKGQKKKGRKVDDHGLRDIPQIAGQDGMLIIQFHGKIILMVKVTVLLSCYAASVLDDSPYSDKKSAREREKWACSICCSLWTGSPTTLK